MTDMKWTTVKRKRKDLRPDIQDSASTPPAPGSDSGPGHATVIHVQQSNGYIRRQLPKGSATAKTVTPEQQQLVDTLYLNLKDISGKVMAAKRSDRETHEKSLEEIRSLLNRIITIDPSRYETPLGYSLEDAIAKIYTVVTK